MNAGRILPLVVAAVGLAACGGSDAPVAVPASSTASDAGATAAPSDAATDAATAAPGDGPVSTLSPELSEDLLPGLRPVDVIGTPLAPLPGPDQPDAVDPAIGEQVPILVGLTYDDDPIRIDPAADGPTMVVFLAHWCPHCNAEVPRLNELRDEGRFPEGLNIVAVSTAARPDRPNWPPAQWLQDVDWTYPAMADGVDLELQSYIAANAYGVTSFPFVAVVRGDGTVATRWSGETEPDEFVARLEDALG